MAESEPIEIELNPRELRLYDRLRASVALPMGGLSSGLIDLILLLPDLVVLLIRLVRDSRVPVGAKIIAGAGVAYVLSPVDLMPELIFGPFGLIDDLLVVSAALSKLIESVHPDLLRHHWPGQGDGLAVIRTVTTWGNEQLTTRLPRLLRRFFRA
jgi:uncharacterized membrane protein YkvA (DUF1232 family)